MSISAGVASPAEGLVCFVCDGTVVGRYYTLASCKTQVTKQMLIEKLGQLVGEQYMVIVSEDDIICRSCTTMMNNLDRLEKEMSSVRAIILRFLEKKYELEDGELASAKIVLPPPPSPPESITAFKKTEISPQTFHERKKQSAKALSDKEEKSNVWMQCDRCKYTTPYSSFMINHIHKHDEVKKTKEEKPDQPEQPTPVIASEPEEKAAGEDTALEAVEVEGMEDEGRGGLQLEANGETEPTTLATTVLDDIAEEGAIVEMNMGEDNADTLCMVDENGLVLQKLHQGEDGQFYVVEGDIDGKQMLVTEDGSVQMVQVMWDDIDNNMQF